MGQQEKRSELWQRIRAARAKARMTQLDVSKALNLSRAAIALWESKDPSIRTQPDAEQVMVLARVLGVPASFLMDDGAETDQVWQFKDSPVPDAGQRRDGATTAAAAFWAAVRYQLLMQVPEVADSIDVPVKGCGVQTLVSFLRNQSMAVTTFVRDDEDVDEVVRRETANLLWAERAAGRRYSKHLLLWARDAAQAQSGLDAECMERVFGVSVRMFNDVNTAATHVLQMS